MIKVIVAVRQCKGWG